MLDPTLLHDKGGMFVLIIVILAAIIVGVSLAFYTALFIAPPGFMGQPKTNQVEMVVPK